MKKLSIYFCLVVVLCACSNKKEVQTEPIAGNWYGEKFEISDVQEAKELNALMNGQDSVVMTLSGAIEKTCAVKGCWMQLKSGDEELLRVSFKDYGFFVPKSGEESKTAIMQGYCVKKETSVDELRHFAQDAGESEEFIAAIISPKLEYSFVASGVLIQ